jgi:competence CoiA-like predicted nuclease
MLTAIYKKDNKHYPINAATLDDNQVDKIRKNKIRFYCQHCEEELLLKAGLIKIKHFSHVKNSDCPAYSESEIHHSCKYTIFQALKEQHNQVFLERRYDLSNQPNSEVKILQYQNTLRKISENYYEQNELEFSRSNLDFYLERQVAIPDISIIYNSNLIAIEIQKTKINKAEFFARTLFYSQFNIPVIWIIPEQELYSCFLHNKPHNPLSFDRNIPSLWNEFKKFYFGKLFTWNPETLLLKTWKTERLSTHRTAWDETGPTFDYIYHYKKLRNFKFCSQSTFDINNFSVNKVKANEEYRIPFDALVWQPKYKDN